MRLITAARSVDIDLIEAKKQKKKQRAISCVGKMLHGQFVQQTKEVGNQDRWQ